MRVFIAMPVPTEIKAKLSDLQRSFRHLPVEASWVHELGFHLTLKFLGETEASSIEPLAAAMTVVGNAYQPFCLTVTGVGVYPSASAPHVLWVGIHDDTGQLLRLQRQLETSLAQLGFATENRPFSAHVTLARLKRVPHRRDFLVHLKTHCDEQLGAFEVDRIELIESRLHPSGARYSTLHTAYFRHGSDSTAVQTSGHNQNS